ncbi:uncharacterized protein [Antedon mediterranea]|uniref:uncharacterized protein n=1 Tax=Antedon mediterranea TaxID=105859 RepID=UPI003AF9B580
MSITITTIYVVGFVAGSGMIALPKVIFASGWYGIISLPVLVLTGYFTALTLSKCWMIIHKKYPEYRQQVRHPYVVIGYVTFGKNGERVMHVLCIVMYFAVSLVTFLLICDNVRLITVQWFDVSFCSWVPIVALILFPIVLLKTPVETQFCAVVSFSTSLVMFSLLMTQIIRDGRTVDDSLRKEQPVVTFSSLTIAWATIGFSTSGHACYPLYQNCMRQPAKFNYSLTIAFLGILVLLCSPVYSSYYFLGGAVYTPDSDNLLLVLSDGPIKSIAGIGLAVHFMMSYIFTLNPLCQQIEELAGIPKRFSWQLVVIRSSILAGHVFLAESVPQFGPLLSLVSACLWIPSAFIAPSVFFLCLKHLMNKRNYVTDSTALHLLVIVLAVILVCCCTYSSLVELITAQSTFTVPCYVNSTAAHI